MAEEFRYTPAQKRALELLGGDATKVMLFGGSRSGKTFVLCCALAVRALKAPGGRHAVLRRHFNGVKTAIGLDTMPKVLRLRFPEVRWEFNRSECFFTFPNRSEIWLVGLDDAQRAEKILGKEFATLYFNECSELDYAGVQTALTRLAQKLPGLADKAFFDCNPPSANHWTHRVFIEKVDPVDRTPLRAPELYAAMRINPADNAENLPAGYIENTLANLPLRQRRRFLEGLWEEETEGALWRRAMIDADRVVAPPAELDRIVIGVDPAVSAAPGSDHTGIVAVGRGAEGRCYVLRDESCRLPPLGWARRVIGLYRELAADRVVAEVNNGGDLVESLLRQLDPDVSYKISARATP